MTENLNIDTNQSSVKNTYKIQHRLWGGKVFFILLTGNTEKTWRFHGAIELRWCRR